MKTAARVEADSLVADALLLPLRELCAALALLAARAVVMAEAWMPPLAAEAAAWAVLWSGLRVTWVLSASSRLLASLRTSLGSGRRLGSRFLAKAPPPPLVSSSSTAWFLLTTLPPAAASSRMLPRPESPRPSLGAALSAAPETELLPARSSTSLSLSPRILSEVAAPVEEEEEEEWCLIDRDDAGAEETVAEADAGVPRELRADAFLSPMRSRLLRSCCIRACAKEGEVRLSVLLETRDHSHPAWHTPSSIPEDRFEACALTLISTILDVGMCE